MKCRALFHYLLVFFSLIASDIYSGCCSSNGTPSACCTSACSCITSSSDCCLPCCPSGTTSNCSSLPCDSYCASTKCNKDVMCKSHFSPRSQGLDTARWLVARHGISNTFDTDEVYGDFSITAEFTRSFKQEKLGKYFTPAYTTTADVCDTSCNSCYTSSCDNSCSCENCYSTSCNNSCGSCSACYSPSCGLCSGSSCSGSSCVSSCCYCNCFTLGDDRWYLQDNTTLLNQVNVRADDFGMNCTGIVGTARLNPRVSNVIFEFNLFVGLTDSLNGLFVELHAPVVHSWWDPGCCTCVDEICSDSFDECLMSTSSENDVGTTDLKTALEGNFTWGDVLNPLNRARICSGRQSKTHLADLRLALGYDLYGTDIYRLGLKLVTAAPTGNVAQACYMFEPIVGNGGHWELGGGLSAHGIWERNDNSSFGLYLEAYVAHMFKSRYQTRTFDLCGHGCWSRYLLLKAFSENGTTYQGLERGPNVFSQNLKVSVDVVGDASLMFSFKHKTWEFDLGYNFWGRSGEKIKTLSCCIPASKYGIKGLAPVCDEDEDVSGDTFTGNLITASKSTIAESAGTAEDESFLFDEDNEPIFISCNDLDCCSALHPSALSHSLFFHMNGTWNTEDDDDMHPFFGIGGKVEWSGRGNRALNQWGIWAKGGVAF